MLNEGRRRAIAGEHVVVGWVELHDRAETSAQLRELEIAPTRIVDYAGRQFEEMDRAVIVALEPEVVLVDELAHVSPDGSRRRWQDVAELLASGMDVLTTVNVANLESARDYAARITGAGMVEPVPDALVRAGEVVLVDLPAEALRRRIAAGKVYSTDRVGGALSRYFETSNLASLSELARAWIDDTLVQRGEVITGATGSAKQSVIAGISASTWAEPVIRHAASLAERDDADLVVVHVDVTDGLDHGRRVALDRYRDLVVELGGIYAEVRGENVAQALASVAREHNSTRIVVARHRSRLSELVRGSIASRLRHVLPDVEVDEVTASP
jgi:two-component system, OmpR family, sensor histidine kinase KdpD